MKDRRPESGVTFRCRKFAFKTLAVASLAVPARATRTPASVRTGIHLKSARDRRVR